MWTIIDQKGQIFRSRNLVLDLKEHEQTQIGRDLSVFSPETYMTARDTYQITFKDGRDPRHSYRCRGVVFSIPYRKLQLRTSNMTQSED